MSRLREWAQRLVAEVAALWFCARHPRTPFADQACMSCHGPSRAHLAPAVGGKRNPPDVVFGKKSPTPVAELASDGAPTTIVSPETATALPKKSFAPVLDAFR